MAGLVEQAQWENEIYQIETTDPVVGGPPNLVQGQGVTNIPHLHLANRTAWLKGQVEALASQISAQSYATQADIDAAIAALIGGAPGALDTLNELAAAIGNNESAAAALVAQIATLTGRTISAGDGLTGGGSLNVDRTLSLLFATDNQAEAMVSTIRPMSPHLTKLAIAAWVNDNLSAAVPSAWVNFNGAGTVAIRDSHNVASITDLGAGHYRVTFATAMSSADYAVVGNASTLGTPADRRSHIQVDAMSAASFDFRTTNIHGTAGDYGVVSLAIVGGQ